MPIFHYKAKMKNAQTVSGQINADHKEDAVDKINQLGLIPVSVEEYSSDGRRKDTLKASRVSGRDLYFFTRQLMNLIKAGVPILRGLEMIESQVRNPYFRSVIGEIRAGVKDGGTFAECLAGYPQVFAPVYTTMVKAGEESGNLKEILSDLAEYLRGQEEVAAKVRAAVVYPVMMFLFGIGTVCFILVRVMPQISGLFVSMDQTLPEVTRFVMALSDGLIKWWPGIILAVLAIFLLFQQWSRTDDGRLRKSQFQLFLPVVGSFFVKVELTRFCRTLYLLLKSGIPIVRAIQLSIPVIGNELIQRDLKKCQEDLIAGRSVGQSLKDATTLPRILGELVMIGEESGNLSGTLQDIAETYEQDIGESIKIATTLLEPLMILVVGAFVGFIVIAMLLPIFQLDIMAR